PDGHRRHGDPASRTVGIGDCYRTSTGRRGGMALVGHGGGRLLRTALVAPCPRGGRRHVVVADGAERTGDGPFPGARLARRGRSPGEDSGLHERARGRSTSTHCCRSGAARSGSLAAAEIGFPIGDVATAVEHRTVGLAGVRWGGQAGNAAGWLLGVCERRWWGDRT